MFAAENVIHLKGEVSVVLMDQAVFAKIVRPLKNKASQSGWHCLIHAAALVRALARALAFARLMT